MNNIQAQKQHNFDLEERTTQFAKEIVRFCKSLQKDPVNTRIISQVVGSTGSIGANHREANDALGKKDFVHRLKIARKESKETVHWLELLQEAHPVHGDDIQKLIKEATELRNILSSIINKTV